MYLFLVDHKYISSELLQKMIGQILPEEDVVNCLSPTTLLKISEKLNPDLVIIDFALVEEDKVDFIETLRGKCPETYVLALIEPRYYEHLYQAIEKSLIDDYIVKPVSEEEFTTRILITTRRRKHDKPLFIAPLPEQPVHMEEEFTVAEPQLPEEPRYQETAASAPSLFEESTVSKSAEPDFSAFHPDEDVYSKTVGDDIPEVNYGEPDLQLTDDRPGSDLELFDQPDLVDKTEDLFDTRIGLFDSSERIRRVAEEANPAALRSKIEPGEDYFDDLFDERYDLKDPAEKSAEPADAPPASTIFDDFDDIPERDFNKPLKDFMPGESADQYLQEKEAEKGVINNEDLLDRFLSDEMEEADHEEDNYDEEEGEPSGSTRFLSGITNTILALLLLMMASLSFFLIHSRVADGPPSLAGFTFHVLQDNDLNADANPGSLAVVRSADVTSIALGDLINFKTIVSPHATSTQRVVEINRDEGLQFVTSGDGAGAVETTVVPAADVLGKVLVSVPFYGRMVDYVQTSQGLILLIFVPGVIIIAYQLIKIIRQLSANRSSGRRGRYRAVAGEE